MQPQPSLRVVLGSIVWCQHVRGACWRWKWEVFGVERPFWGQNIIALAVPAPELMQPQPSLRVDHGSIVWRQHMGGAHRGAKMGGFGAERPFWGHFCTGHFCGRQLGTVPYIVPYFTVFTVKYGVIITVVRRNLTSTVRGAYRTDRHRTVPYNSTSLNTIRLGMSSDS